MQNIAGRQTTSLASLGFQLTAQGPPSEGSTTCWAEMHYPPNGYWTSDGNLYASVAGEYYCGTIPHSVTITVCFLGRTGSQSINTCNSGTYNENSEGDMTAWYSYTPQCGEEGTYDHYGSVMITYTLGDGSTYSDGMYSPHNAGEYWRNC